MDMAHSLIQPKSKSRRCYCIDPSSLSLSRLVSSVRVTADAIYSLDGSVELFLYFSFARASLFPLRARVLRMCRHNRLRFCLSRGPMRRLEGKVQQEATIPEQKLLDRIHVHLICDLF